MKKYPGLQNDVYRQKIFVLLVLSQCDVAPELEMRMSCFSEIDQVDDL